LELLTRVIISLERAKVVDTASQSIYSDDFSSLSIDKLGIIIKLQNLRVVAESLELTQSILVQPVIPECL
jgi:hypothetical protein